MSKLLSLIAAAGLALSLGAAPTLASAKTAQQEKMSTCNAQAAGKKGDERKAFMKGCLSAKPAAAPATQQEKMKVCNKEAAGKKGDERKAFMSDCLKK
ncbi:MAG: phosphate starvation-inducible protein PsiF [Burkholderiaceae bacterium]|nr:phosphate starvation-inducible protein PsiF [Pseudomonadota bacterium]MBS0596414.1 phosphate starvation-inducible protein PsiF [Pseudomonadota bacterium]MCO5117188.1 PsiF family protein [Burkholderiaceae bacterium]MCP5216794.1 phosphate starvation-inducible protein PsiF [Burkholderiaceae bacterium]